MEKSLKKLNRMQLLELLMQASQKNEALVAENAALREDAAKQRKRLPQAAKVGSIAEAALQANGYFDAAQRAADDYLREIKRLRDQVASRAQQAGDVSQAAGAPEDRPRLRDVPQLERRPQQVNAQAYIQDAQARANEILGRANAQAQAIVAQAQMRSDSLLASARSQSDSIVAAANQQARVIVSQANRHADSVIQSAGRRGQDRGPAHVAGATPASGNALAGRGRHVRFSDGVMA